MHAVFADMPKEEQDRVHFAMRAALAAVAVHALRSNERYVQINATEVAEAAVIQADELMKALEK